MKHKVFTCALLCLASFALTSCGQPGPLYLPGHPPPGYDAPPSQQPKAKSTQDHTKSTAANKQPSQA